MPTVTVNKNVVDEMEYLREFVTVQRSPSFGIFHAFSHDMLMDFISDTNGATHDDVEGQLMDPSMVPYRVTVHDDDRIVPMSSQSSRPQSSPSYSPPLALSDSLRALYLKKSHRKKVLEGRRDSGLKPFQRLVHPNRVSPRSPRSPFSLSAAISRSPPLTSVISSWSPRKSKNSKPSKKPELLQMSSPEQLHFSNEIEPGVPYHRTRSLDCVSNKKTKPPDMYRAHSIEIGVVNSPKWEPGLRSVKQVEEEDFSPPFERVQTLNIFDINKKDLPLVRRAHSLEIYRDQQGEEHVVYPFSMSAYKSYMASDGTSEEIQAARPDPSRY